MAAALARRTAERSLARTPTMKRMLARLITRFWSVGASSADVGSALLTYRRGLEDEPTATFLHHLRPPTSHELDATLTRAQQITGTPCPRVFLDAGAPGWVEAALIARDWKIDAVLQLVLPAGAAPPPRPASAPTIRSAEPADWEQLGALFRVDHEEEDRKFGRQVRPEGVTRGVVAARQQLHDPVRYFVAVDDGIAGFVAAWPGDDGTGLIEDLFVRPADRGQKVALALIAHAVDWVRTRGADAIVIGAEPEDTPKHLYARLGFVPTDVLRTATRDSERGRT